MQNSSGNTGGGGACSGHRSHVHDFMRTQLRSMASAVAPISPQNLHGFWAGKRADEGGWAFERNTRAKQRLPPLAPSPSFHEDDDDGGAAAAKLKFGTRRDESERAQRCLKSNDGMEDSNGKRRLPRKKRGGRRAARQTAREREKEVNLVRCMSLGASKRTNMFIYAEGRAYFSALRHQHC